LCHRGDKSKQIYINNIIHKIIKYIIYTALRPMDDNITRVTFSFWTMNLLGKMHLAIRMGGGDI